MADRTAERMLRTARGTKKAGGATREASSAGAFVKTPKTFPRRVTLDLTDADYNALRDAAHHDRASIAELLRCLVDQWKNDRELAAAVTKALARTERL